MISTFAPKWASAPGATIQAILQERGLRVEYLAAALGGSTDDARALLEGRAAINAERANRLSQALGGSARFWLTREAEYSEDRLRLRAADWSSNLPLPSMRRLGWITGTRDWHEQIDQCLQFFGVLDFEEWMETYPPLVKSAHYRTSAAHENKEGATLVWFRAADISAPPEPVAPFRPEVLRSSLSEFRNLTRVSDPHRFVPELKRIAARSGLSIRVVPAPAGCRASGATRWNGTQPTIQLSARHLSDDHFWFTFFHELGHTLLHAEHRETFIDDDLDRDTTSKVEREADSFAESTILGGAQLEGLPTSGPRDIIRTAVLMGIGPGLLVGQLQHAGRIPPSKFNHLKRRYRWEGATLLARRA